MSWSIRGLASALWLCFALSALFAPSTAHGLVQTSNATPYSACLNRSAKRYRLASSLLKGVVATESNWDPNARSSANAHGLMQIQWPGTARHLGVRFKSQLYQPCKNIDLGARYLRQLIDRYQGDERLALAAYNYGPGRISASKPIPRGAERYVAKVYKHAAMFGGQRDQSSAKAKKGGSNSVPPSTVQQRKRRDHALVVFTSRDRAQRYVRLLARRIEGASFRMQPVDQGRYQVWMQVKPAGLSGDEKLILSSFGWQL